MRYLPSCLSLRLVFGFSLALVTIAPLEASAQIVVSIGPPKIPIEVQPASPGVAFVWAPGHWGRNASGYAWIQGSWLMPPSSGMLWTPGYWRPQPGGFSWQPGRWGSTVGYYGGVNYGFGYMGSGFTPSSLRHDEIHHELQHYREDGAGKPGGLPSYPNGDHGGNSNHTVTGPQPGHGGSGYGGGRPNAGTQDGGGSTGGGGNTTGTKGGTSSASGVPAGSATPSGSPMAGRATKGGPGTGSSNSGEIHGPR